MTEGTATTTPTQVLPDVSIYSDGGADPNPGPGGWGAVMLFTRAGGEVTKKELSGGEALTTNNRMELTAAIQALRALDSPHSVSFYADSQYVVRGITEWIIKWRTKLYKDVENADLWRELEAEAARHTIRWHWVKGHAGNEHNERADQLATEAMPKKRETADLAAVRAYMRVSCVGTTGGWAVLMARPEGEMVLSEGAKNTTPNRLDLQATIAALSALAEGEAAQFFTASSYLYTGITEWVKNWKRNNWQKKTGGEVQNRDLWERAEKLSALRDVRWVLYSDQSRPIELERLSEPLREVVERARRG
jgi:ribonuclease HI